MDRLTSSGVETAVLWFQIILVIGHLRSLLWLLKTLESKKVGQSRYISPCAILSTCMMIKPLARINWLARASYDIINVNKPSNHQYYLDVSHLVRSSCIHIRIIEMIIKPCQWPQRVWIIAGQLPLSFSQSPIVTFFSHHVRDIHWKTTESQCCFRMLPKLQSRYPGFLWSPVLAYFKVWL